MASSPAAAASAPLPAAAAPAPAAAFTGGHAHDSFAERAAAELAQAYPDRAAKRTRRELLALIERGRERARGYGLEQDEHVLKFLHCVMLLDNELAKPSNADVAYVIDTLSVPNKPADRRIDRALNIAKKVAASAPPPKATGSSSAAGGPAPAPPSRSAPSRSGAAPAAGTTPGRPASPPSSAAHPPRSANFGAAGAQATVDDSVRSTKSEPPPLIDDWRPADESESFPQIEGFRILDKLAAGGMGTVYRAMDLQLDIEVAIKVLRSMHPAAQQQFLIEARAAAKLQHPHIIPVLRYEQYGQGGYCVMQLVKGKDAHRLVKSFGESVAHEQRADKLLELAGIDRAMMNPELRTIVRGPKPYYRMVAYWLAGVAEALDRAHAEGIVHYDVKPSNMLLSPDGRMLLGDFGLATFAGQHASQNAAACVGTPGYLSPEMLAAWASRAGAAETDARVDIWGLGCTLYEMLAYKPAFDGTLAKVLRAIATTDPVPPRDAVWHVPQDLERICLKALARNPDERYARALEMADALRDFLSGKPIAGDDEKKSGWFGRKPK